MVQENPNSVTPSGVIPNDPNPDSGKGIPFSLAVDEAGTSGNGDKYLPGGEITIQEYNNGVRERNAEKKERVETNPLISEEDVEYEELYDAEEDGTATNIEAVGNDNASFNPVYYPDRYNDTLEKEVERTARQCGGEDVSVDKTKNPEFHATGIVLDGNVSDFRAIRNYKGPVNLITPLTDNEGGMEVVITKGSIGEIVGWDGIYKQWQFNYTLDMVATGFDTDNSGENQVVSEVLDQYRES